MKRLTLLLFVFIFCNISYSQSSPKIEDFLKGYHQLYNKSEIETLKSDVFSFFELDFNSDLKKQKFKTSKEYKVLSDSLNSIKSTIKGLSYIKFNGYSTYLDVNKYDIKRGGFNFFTGNRTSENFSIRNVVDLEFINNSNGNIRVSFTNLETNIKNVEFERGNSISYFKDEHLFIPFSRKNGELIEENRSNPEIYILFNCTGVKTINEYQKWSGITTREDYLTGTIKRIIVVLDDLIVYNKTY
jgi:hypothetical protein